MILTYIFAIAIMIHWLLAVSDGHFWQPAEFKNVVNPDFENLKHLQNLGFFFLISDCMTPYLIYMIFWQKWGGESERIHL